MTTRRSFTIEAGMGATQTVKVEKDCVLVFTIKASDTISVSNNNNTTTNSEWTKAIECRTMLCQRNGDLVFEFGNQTAWFRSVLVEFEFDLFFPLCSGLERPYCVLVQPGVLESDSILLDCRSLPIPKILSSGRRFWGFTSELECQRKTGRGIDFNSEAELVNNLALELHQYLTVQPTITTTASKLQVVLGTFIFDTMPLSVCRQMLELFFSQPGREEIDTGRSYGKSEEILGKLLFPFPQAQVSTKVNPFPYSGIRLDAENIKRQVHESFQALKRTKVKILYLHQPDSKTSLEITLEEINRLYAEQACMFELGLSNFSAWQVVLIYHLCQQRGWVVPTVYQGVYNVLARDVEPELFPALRAHKIRFLSYNPLAGGLLTGRHQNQTLPAPKGTRFTKGNAIGDRYLESGNDRLGISLVNMSFAFGCFQG
ncbi:hypothetical protein BASA81_000127 [Batrachochytrium salamandrivorans]|nr:hypothetical protein BASA81_000127 [Batrachochytrium salamandrivorans]